MAPFVEAIKQALLVDARRPKKERRTAKALLKQISEAGYEGGYSRLTDFIRDWRTQQGGVASGKAFVPLAFELGEAFQFDWSEEGLVIGGIYRRLQVAHMKLLTLQQEKSVFVFGSNLAGRHGKGAALFARLHHGAVYGRGEGLQGGSYAIPTKDACLRTLPLDAISRHVARFKLFAAAHPELKFEVTAVGCGLAGYAPERIAPLFQGVPATCALPPEFSAVLCGHVDPSLDFLAADDARDREGHGLPPNPDWLASAEIQQGLWGSAPADDGLVSPAPSEPEAESSTSAVEVSVSPIEATSVRLRTELVDDITRLLIGRGWNASEAARRIGITRAQMNDLLGGNISRFALDDLVDIASLFGADVPPQSVLIGVAQLLLKSAISATGLFISANIGSDDSPSREFYAGR